MPEATRPAAPCPAARFVRLIACTHRHASSHGLTFHGALTASPSASHGGSIRSRSGSRLARAAMASSTSTSGDERPAGVPRDPSSVTVPGPQTHAEWAASMQAYYAAAQHMVAAAAAAGAGAPMPFAVYHPAYYAHASMAAGVPYPAAEAATVLEGSSRMKSSCAPSGDGSSRSVRSSDGGSEETSDKGDNAQADLKVLPSSKRRKRSNANMKGESSQAGTQDATAGFPFAPKGRSASKLSVPTPEKAAVSDVAPNLNIGMDIWGGSPAKAETSEQGEMNAGLSSQHAGALSRMQDEREMKRERRKQSNRESARRSRLRKQIRT